ncbi:MAG: FtsX-like permease family protein [Nakamurella sp.]
MTVGVAVVLLAVLASTAVAGGVSSLTERANGRFPVASAEGGSFQASITSDYLGATPLRVVRVASKPGANPPAPPGCSTFPAAGQSCVSPALQRALLAHPALAGKFGTFSGRIIAESGLTNGAELVGYIGVAYDTAGSVGSASGWGRINGSAPPLVSGGFVTVVLLLLVGLPGLIFLAVCGRLSASVRARRIRILRMLGAPRRTIAVVTASEGLLAGVLAAICSLLLWRWADPWFARSGLAGFQWFPDATPLTALTVAVTVVGTPLVTGWLATVGNRRSRRQSAAAKVQQPATRVRFVVLWLGLLACGWYFWDAHRTTHPQSWLFLLTAALLASGVLIAARPLVEWFSASRAPRARSVVTRLAWRRLEFDSAAVIRVVSGAAVFVLVATIGLAVARDVDLTVTDPGPTIALTVATNSTTTPPQRAAVKNLPGVDSYATVPYSTSKPGDTSAAPNFATAIFTSCRNLASVVGHAVPACHDGTNYRVTDNNDGMPASVPARAVLIDQTDTTSTLSAPDDLLDLGSGGVGLADLVITTQRTAVPAGATYRFQVGNSDTQIITFQEQLASISPTLVAEPGTDIDLIRTFHAIKGILQITAVLGFLLGIGTLTVASIDRAVERRREVAHLTAIGVATRTIRTSQALQLAVAAAMCLITTALVGQLIAQAYLQLGGDQHGWYWPSLDTAVALAAVGVLTCALSGTVVFGRRLSYALFAPT